MAGFFQHPLALVESKEIGEGTRIWAWSHVMDGATIGRDCNIGGHCFVEGGARLGHRVTVKNGVALWDGVVVEDDVFLGPCAVLTNDPLPRSRNPDFRAVATTLARGCSIGANATVLCGLRVGVGPWSALRPSLRTMYRTMRWSSDNRRGGSPGSVAARRNWSSRRAPCAAPAIGPTLCRTAP